MINNRHAHAAAFLTRGLTDWSAVLSSDARADIPVA
jgi:hypothetical protein